MRNKLTKPQQALLLRMRDDSPLGKFQYLETSYWSDISLVYNNGGCTAFRLKRTVSVLTSKGYLKEFSCIANGYTLYTLTDLGKQTIQELLKQQTND